LDQQSALASAKVGRVSEPIGDDFFAVQVSDDPDDDQAVLIVGKDHISIEFVDLGDLAGVIEKLKPRCAPIGRSSPPYQW